MNPHPVVVALASVFLSALAQVALKIGMGKALAANAGHGEAPLWRLLLAGFAQPTVLTGLAMYVGGALLWLYVLSRWDVSKAYPLVGLGFALTFVVGVAFLGERLSWERLIGCLLICAGAVLVVRS